ncbi:MAG TPA: hypothetical protein VFY90_10550 [Tepidiformaceae bacterium]|jgi:hypothetical protein|nr:hypothetical protein [Tepidiformaceae bacterium]
MTARLFADQRDEIVAVSRIVDAADPRRIRWRGRRNDGDQSNHHRNDGDQQRPGRRGFVPRSLPLEGRDGRG